MYQNLQLDVFYVLLGLHSVKTFSFKSFQVGPTVKIGGCTFSLMIPEKCSHKTAIRLLNSMKTESVLDPAQKVQI